MSSRKQIIQTVSDTEPVGAALGDEWFQLSTNKLFKRIIYDNVVSWVEIPLAIDGTSFRAPEVWGRKTSNYTAVDGDKIVADTTAGTFTITLPANPSIGTYVQIADGGEWATTNLIIGRNGATIENLAEDLTVDISGAILEFVYSGTTWNVFTSIGTSSSSLVTLNSAQTLTNKRITPRVNLQTTANSLWFWNSDNFDMHIFTGLSQSILITADEGTPTDGQTTTFRFKDNGVACGLSWVTTMPKSFREVNVVLPTTTVVGKVTYVGCIYNELDLRWDVIAVAQEA